MSKDVIVACDFDSAEQTLAFLSRFEGKKPFVKIGMELYYAAGPDSPPVVLARMGRFAFSPIRIPMRVLMRLRPSAPPSAQALAMDTMSVTLGDNFR